MAEMTAAEINDLPDSAFAYIEPGGTKDDEGKTVPRSKRHFPIHDKAHVQNALARMGSSPFGDKAKAAILAAAKKFGIDVSEDNSAARAAFELRRRRRGSMVRQLERRRMPFTRGNIELRAKPDGTGGTTYEFEGYGAVFDTPFDMWDPWGDPYVEVVRQGAFTQTLAASPDVPFLIGHNDMGVPLARTRSGTMQLSQDTRGLHVLAQMDGGRSDVRNLASAVDRGDLDEMSIGFITMPGGQQWSPDWMQRDMLHLDLHRGDVSAVALAANTATAGATMIALSSGRPRERRAPTQPYTAHPGEVNECPQCHSMNDDTASFCDQCGKKMMPASHVANMAGVEDMSQACGCGKWNSADARYCGGCGRELGGDGAAASYGGGWWSQQRPGGQQLAASHSPFKGRHSHAHPAFGSQGGDASHAHEHSHDGDADHDHTHESRAAGRPGEQLAARGEINDSSNQPDFNLATDDPAANGASAVKCPYTVRNGCGQMCPGGSKFCSNCGGPIYDGDGQMVLDDSGVVEEVNGDMADADLLSRRLRLLELA